MDANPYALKIRPAAKTLAMLLNQAYWLGKGQPPRQVAEKVVAVPVVEEPLADSKTAAKEKTDAPVSSLAADVEVRAQEIVITRDDRRYRVRGFAQNTYHLLKIDLLASRGDGSNL